MSDRILSIYAERISLGSRGMRDELIRRGHRVNRKKVQRLMRKLGLKSQAPGPHTSLPRKDNSIYPYLLKDAVIKGVDEVWSIDITYIRVGKGFMYLTAIIDWYSRYIVAWELSNSMDVHAQLKALDKALASGRKPKIFNTDQGSQFTSIDFTGHLKNTDIYQYGWQRSSSRQYIISSASGVPSNMNGFASGLMTTVTNSEPP